MQQAEEVVGDIGSVVPWVQLLGQHEEGLGVMKEELEFKNCLGVRQVVLLQVTVEAAA